MVTAPPWCYMPHGTPAYAPRGVLPWGAAIDQGQCSKPVNGNRIQTM